MSGYIPKIEKNIAGTSFLDELHTNVGASPFNINHDYFWGSTDFEIWTAAGKTGTQLIDGVDYTLSGSGGTKAAVLSTESGKTVYTTVTIITAGYQTGNLYFNGYYIGDDNKYEDLEYRIRHSYNIAKTADFSILTTEWYDLYKVTTGAALVIPSLPTAASAEDQIVKIQKMDTGAGCIRITPNGAEQIIAKSGASLDYLFLFKKGDIVELMSNGTDWFIINSFVPYFDFGWINRSDWTNVHLGFAQITYSGASGSFIIGETITESTSGNTWILIYDSGTVFTCVNATGTGVATNAETLTGGTSAETATVNGSTKNVDTLILHNCGLGFELLKNPMITLSSDKTQANSYRTIETNKDGAINWGLGIIGIDNDSFKINTGNNGEKYMDDNGIVQNQAGSDWYYNGHIEL